MSKDSQPSQNAKVQKGKGYGKPIVSFESRGLSPTPKKHRVPREEELVPKNVKKEKASNKNGD